MSPQARKVSLLSPVGIRKQGKSMFTEVKGRAGPHRRCEAGHRG